MIRTDIVPCSLPKGEADTLNRRSARIYSGVLTTRYRVYRRSHQQHWLSPRAAERLNDYLKFCGQSSLKQEPDAGYSLSING